MSAVVVKRYVGGLAGGRRCSIRRRSDGNFQIYNDNPYVGINQPYQFDDEPVSGIFGDLVAAEAEFIRTHPGFETAEDCPAIQNNTGAQ
jgi:hypothetical protein